MEKSKEQNAVAALLAEYKKAIKELQDVIENLEPTKFTKTADPLTDNPDCKSIQTVLPHVVSSGYSYCVYILNLKDPEIKRPAKILRASVAEYKKDLDDVLQFTHETLGDIKDYELEEFDSEKKMKTSWGQVYDIEQIMEHAIVHILRHRRQVEKFRKQVSGSHVDTLL
ncbi:MAG: DinB family protein [Bacteroidota bacterium]|nr:DinB family protein [Bacteroidota bacterium]